MRRGHSGFGGWRNENPRHFRPRNAGTPPFRATRGYAQAEAPRFQPPPGPRPLLNLRYAPPGEQMPAERQGYRGGRNNQRRALGRGQYPHQGPRQVYPFMHRMRPADVPDQHFYKKSPSPWDTNNIGNTDLRTLNRPNPWANNYNYEDRSPAQNYRHQDNTEHNKIPQPDYTGHRPPASDHYGGSHGSTMDSTNTFSRSVDDTVDIVRRRLMNRSSQSSESPPHSLAEAEKNTETETNRYSCSLPDQPTKKKTTKMRNMKSNCDKIKNKIMHQLFMMDKDKIHKLMDNPNCSSKFEYAISSLVTESQNSFNRHLRSVAEKSLCSASSTEFIHDDNNTIYEDTFMKQMQCILDPQDTVLLEDIKPIVLAELSRVLQLDDLQLRQEAEATSANDQALHDQYPHDANYPYDDYNNHPYSPIDEPDDFYEQKQRFERPPSPDFSSNVDFSNRSNVDFSTRSNVDFSSASHDFDSKYLYERRTKPNRRDSYHRATSDDRPRRDNSIDRRSEENFAASDISKPLFDGNSDQLSDEEDPFAELDRQYHVAVDHNFIKHDCMSSPQTSNRSSRAQSPIIKKEITNQVHKHESEMPPLNKVPAKIVIKTPEKPSSQIKEDIDNQLQDMAKSPLKFLSPPSKKTGIETIVDLTDNITLKSESHEDNESGSVSEQREPTPEPPTDTSIKAENAISVIPPATPVDSRKRSSDQKPSHRKEKRKKSDSSQQETSKQILNKNIIIHVSDCTAKPADKSIFNLYFSKENNAKETSKDCKKVESSDKKYSDRHVKRKEKDSSISKKPKEKDVETRKKHDSNTNHSILSPTDTSQSASKVDSQAKLKPIDMFNEQKKPTPVHLAHRNTAAPPTPTKTTPVELKPVVLSRKVTKRHMATQVVRKCSTKETQTAQTDRTESKSSSSKSSQTDKKKLMTRGAQTDPVSFKPTSKSTDTFERMKEIDMEIQALLQEKFKLYNSLESKESRPNTMQSLGMAVLNVAPVETLDENQTDELSEDTIVEEFANIPVEELEQIALESVQDEQDQEERHQEMHDQQEESKKNRRQKVQEMKRRSRNSSISTNASTSSRSKRTGKPPNISLLEQIITDNRPLEDIISLEDLESAPEKKVQSTHKKKPQKIVLSLQGLKNARKKKEIKIVPLEELGKPANKKEHTSSEDLQSSSRNKIPTKEKAQRTSLEDLESSTRKKARKNMLYLEELEHSHKKKSHKNKFKPKKKVSNKTDAARVYDIKECSVCLERQDLNKLLQRLKTSLQNKNVPACTPESADLPPAVESTQPEETIQSEPPVANCNEQSAAQTVLMVEAAINDIQFDMLDVSEDIEIIDENTVKCCGEKEANDPSPPTVCEEIILDNSQSSADAESPASTECKIYDYSADENLRRDSITVSGNGDAVLAIECIDNNFIAACLDGNVYYFNGEGRLLNTLRGSNLAVTCLTVVRERGKTTVYTGSLDSRIRYYDLDTGLERGPECNVLSPIQTMDRAWDTVFVGTRTGFVLQFECKNNMLIPVSTVKFSEQSILALRAMKEGPRKVVLVAARSEPVTVRDAGSGLLLRTLSGPAITVYTLLLDDGRVYAGTSSHLIHVFDYASGSHMGCHSGGKGAVCLRAAGGLVFAGCYDGCVYVYREGSAAPLAQLRGPSLMLLSLAVQHTKIIAGYKDRSLYIWKIPQAIFQEMIL